MLVKHESVVNKITGSQETGFLFYKQSETTTTTTRTGNSQADKSLTGFGRGPPGDPHSPRRGPQERGLWAALARAPGASGAGRGPAGRYPRLPTLPWPFPALPLLARSFLPFCKFLGLDKERKHQFG